MFSYTNLLEGFVTFLGPDAENITGFFELDDNEDLAQENLETQEENDLLSQSKV